MLRVIPQFRDTVTTWEKAASARIVPPLIDLRPLCRDPKILSRVHIWTGFDKSEWLQLGQIRLTRRNNPYPGIWELSAYLDQATDFEHDSAFALKMDVAGLELDMVLYGQVHLTGWVRADDLDSFRVPGSAAYDPRKHAEATKCTDCKGKDKHWIVPFYTPPPNPELYDLVRGRRIEICTGILESE